MSWHTKTIKEISSSLQSKEISSQELATYFLQRISATTDLNAFVDLNEEQTMREAKLADEQLAKGNQSLLMGIPDRKSTRLNSSHIPLSRMPSSA